MKYKVEMTEDAERDIDEFVNYLISEKKNEQAAGNLMDDLEETIVSLSTIAGNLKYCENPRLRQFGYRRMNFLSHRYFILYRIIDDTVIIDNVFHELQDFEKRMF